MVQGLNFMKQDESIIKLLHFEGCGCPWCGMVTMVLLQPNDSAVIGICNECGKRYMARVNPEYGFGILMTKPTQREIELYGHSSIPEEK